MDYPKNDQTLIRNFIRKNYEGSFYSEIKFKSIIGTLFEQISKTLKINNNTDMENIYEFVAQYTHFSTKLNGYHFNLKRKQTKKKEDYIKLFSMWVPAINDARGKDDVDNVNDDIFIKNEEDIVTDNNYDKNNNDNYNAFLDSSDKINSIQFKQLENDILDKIGGNDKSNDGENNNVVEKIINKIVKEEQYNMDSEEEQINTEDLDDLEKEMFAGFKTKNIVIIDGMYEFPNEKIYSIKKQTDVKNGPYGTQWFHDIQVHDPYDAVLHKRGLIYDVLRSKELPEQRSPEWFAMRHGAITASDAGTVLGLNKHEPTFNFIVKKCIGRLFKSNKFCYHGKKLEEIATMIYEYRMNVIVEEFGLMMHHDKKKSYFLGASPDGICCRTKLDGKSQSKFVGRMLEIKCPYSRHQWKNDNVEIISFDYKKKDVVCPIYYWCQVQLQLECCDLEECDFWQCDLKEYKSKQEFIDDTDPNEPFRSRSFGFEKGCLIQLFPKKRIQEAIDGNYNNIIYEDADFIYPTRIEMTPYECDLWIAEQMEKINTEREDKPFYDEHGNKEIRNVLKYGDFVFDKVLYWRLEYSKNVTFKRDREWFAEAHVKLKKMWKHVEFFRENDYALKIFKDYLDSRKQKKNKDIMAMVENLTNPKMENYDLFIQKIKNDIKIGYEKKSMYNNKLEDMEDHTVNIANQYANFAFVDDDNNKKGGQGSKSGKNGNDCGMFCSDSDSDDEQIKKKKKKKKKNKNDKNDKKKKKKRKKKKKKKNIKTHKNVLVKAHINNKVKLDKTSPCGPINFAFVDSDGD
jgi:putative phage-type endonuclease